MREGSIEGGGTRLVFGQVSRKLCGMRGQHSVVLLFLLFLGQKCSGREWRGNLLAYIPMLRPGDTNHVD